MLWKNQRKLNWSQIATASIRSNIQQKEAERRERDDLNRPKNKAHRARRAKIQCAIPDADREAHDENARPIFDNR